MSWRSVKQSCIADSTMVAEYVAACEAAKEAVWLKKFLSNLGIMRMEQVLHCFATIVEWLHNPTIQGVARKESTQKESTTSFETLLLKEMQQQQRLIVQIIQQIPLPNPCHKGLLSHIQREWELDQCTIFFRASERLLGYVPFKSYCMMLCIKLLIANEVDLLIFRCVCFVCNTNYVFPTFLPIESKKSWFTRRCHGSAKMEV